MVDEKRVWADWADAWPKRRAERGEVVDSLVLAFAREHLKGRVLDAGCGDGFYTSELAGLGFEVTGADVTGELLARARTQHPELPFLEARLDGLPFSDAAFDSVFCLTVLEWVHDPLASLRELRRVTKPGGALVLGILGAGNRTRDLHIARFYGSTPMNGLLPWELELLCQREGLEVTASLGVTRDGPLHGGRDAMTRAMLWLFALKTA